MSAKSVFTFTTGRSGTAWLAEFFRQNLPQDSTVLHEIFDPYAFGTVTPEVSTLMRYNEIGPSDPVVEAFWNYKAQTVHRAEGDIYVETSHVLCKAGLIDYIELFPMPRVIFLKRDRKLVKASMQRRLDYINFGTIWLFYLDPRYGRNLTTVKSVGQETMIDWYLDEMEARARQAKKALSKMRVPYREFNLLDLANEQDTSEARLLLQPLRSNDEPVIIPPPRN
ncbi:MAG: hypothetical protein ACWGQW_05075 [bacterium]